MIIETYLSGLSPQIGVLITTVYIKIIF